MNQFDLKPCTLNVLRALSVMCIAAPIIAHAQQATDLGTVGASGTGTTNAAVPAAAQAASSQGSLTARSAESVVSDNFVRDFTSPVADYSQVFQITPGAFSYSPNGVGQGNASTTIRGLTDSQYLVTFDGIPFNDTNGVSHHSYVFFPTQTVGGAVVDRSPGSAATIGQATFGGSLNLMSRTLETQEHTSVTASYGTWDTTLLNLEHETGQFGQDGASNLFFNVEQMKSNGYQTYNDQNRDAISAKYQYIVSPNTVFTAFTSYLELRNNQANANATRAQLAEYGDNFLNTNNPSLPTYYGYNTYDVVTSFQYVGITSNLGGGWQLDDKVYNYGYNNKQNYPGAAVPVNVAAKGATPAIPNTANDAANDSGTDKLNSYHTTGNLLRLSQDSAMGTLRTGLWTEYANSFRYQTPQNPLNLADAPEPNFSETYQTYTVQPYVEYEFKVTDDLKITPGLKYASYKQDFDHLQDLGKGVGPLGGTINKTTDAITGGLPSISNSVSYSDFLPSLDAHYMLRPNWSAYAQYAAGDLIPPTSVFDVPFAQTTTPPKPQKSDTFQVGTVYKSDRYTMDVDAYHVKLDNSYTCSADPSDPSNTICVATGTEITEGIEAESTIILGGGFNLYVNGTLGSTKYSGGTLDGKWVPGAPGNTETLGLTYAKGPWDSAIYAKRVGKLYNNGGTTDAFTIDPVVLTNLFINYKIKNPVEGSKQAKLQLAINNLFDQHSVTALSGKGSDANPLPADTPTLLPARSIALTLTVDF
jgi:iron complex outermembrane receptor protein